MDKKATKTTEQKAPDKGLEADYITSDIDINLQNPPSRIPGIRLNVGSGADYKEGFINVDAFEKQTDIQAFAHQLPFTDNSVAQIICYQTLEHLPQDQTIPVLKEFNRVLKKGGDIIVTVPDIVSTCKRLLEDPENDWSMARIYGNQTHGGQFHKAGFTPKRLFKLCGFAGFRFVNIAYYSEQQGVKDIYVNAIK